MTPMLPIRQGFEGGRAVLSVLAGEFAHLAKPPEHSVIV
jgi:hypothetical protein